MIKEIMVSDPITYESQPDGGRTPIIDPYIGCQINCPYCFQWSDKQWNRDIYVNINIAELLSDRLGSWNKDETIYFGSKCDPYMQLEERYSLTRKCLEVLNELKINTMITTKSDNRLIFRDIDIIKNFNAEMTVLMGLSNINQIGKGSQNKNILTANELNDNSIEVWAFITPVLPYIMDVEAIISMLNPNIPIFIDKLRIDNDPIREKKMSEFIEKQYPNLKEKYNEIIYENDENYFIELVEKYSNDSIVKILF